MKTIREEKVGKATLRVVETGGGYGGIVILEGKPSVKVDGNDPDALWAELLSKAAASSPNYFGYGGAINRFSSLFPDGFASSSYADHERNYKIEAKQFLEASVPLESALNGTGHADAIKSVFNKTNLLSPFEKMRVIDCLTSDQAYDFIHGAAIMASGDTKAGLSKMAKALKPHDAAKWTAVTYLPFLWRPDSHMFLKPEITKDFAERVGHSFFTDYETAITVDVYEILLDLVRTTEQEIASLNPQDHIDVQSFIWIVGAYKDGETSVGEG
ncbi:MAG: hypothetical protein A2516_10585 [Alphaproteobacteria bacterium RIFOXYD12_FULL_60_8]|nr:MAG: hypothetical protein A2516_10585 [Alphaproteobacteria bacterium RIFOXYD12_FULL_60_8]